MQKNVWWEPGLNRFPGHPMGNLGSANNWEMVLVLHPMGNLGIGIGKNGQSWCWYCNQWATMGLVLVLHPMGILGFANNWENFHPRWIKREQNSNRKQNNTENSIHINIQKDNFRSIKKKLLTQVYVVVLQGSLSCVLGASLVRMARGDILRWR